MIVLIMPVYGAFDYARRALASFFKYTSGERRAVVVIDGGDEDLAFSHADAARDMQIIQHVANRGMIAALNTGFRFLREPFAPGRGLFAHPRNTGEDFTIVMANSDVLFPVGWQLGICHALDSHALVGPLTNAPGTERNQQVSKYMEEYFLEDDEDYLNRVSGYLLAMFDGKVEENPLNGFFLAARYSTLRDNMFNDELFRPRNEVNSKGQPNPDPLNCLHEYEFQARLATKGLKTGIALSSFIFHYRSVSRGARHAKGQMWLRREGDFSMHPA
jgi:glycosyltransferase involved in cell wall biosynthesis